MKDELDAPIKYNRDKLRYYYDGNGVLVVKWQNGIDTMM
jgi:hypothetical protein